MRWIPIIQTKILLFSRNHGVELRTLKYDFQLSRLRDIANKLFSMIGRSVLEDVHDVTAGFELR